MTAAVALAGCGGPALGGVTSGPQFVGQVAEGYYDLICRVGYEHAVEYDGSPVECDPDTKVMTFYEGMAWTGECWQLPRTFDTQDVQRRGSSQGCQTEHVERYMGVALDYDLCEMWWEQDHQRWGDRSRVGPIRVVTWTLVWQQLALGRSQRWLREHVDALRAPETWPLRW